MDIIHVAWTVIYAVQSMKNNVLCAVIETQMNTQLLFCINVNKPMVNHGKYFTDFNFCGSLLTAKYHKIGGHKNFPFYGITMFDFFLFSALGKKGFPLPITDEIKFINTNLAFDTVRNVSTYQELH